MALAGIGFAISVLVQADATVKRLNTRFKHHTENQDKVNAIQLMFVSNTEVLRRCEQALRENSVPLTANLAEARTDHVTEIQQLTGSIYNDMRELENKYFRSSLPSETGDKQGGDWLARQRERFRRLGRANKIYSTLCKVEKASKDLKRILNDLRRELSLEEKIDAIPRDDECIPCFPLPENQDRTVLHFDSVDTLEGKLKAKVLESGDSSVVAASGAKTHGIVGMGGVGKTVAMTGLASQKDIRFRFDGGIYFMSFGQEATLGKIIDEIANIVDTPDGSEEAEKVRASRSVRDAAKVAVRRFTQKPCLFLCDDLWATESDTGFFQDLRILVTGHARSRMVVTTRDSRIANQAGSEVPFSTRDPTGPVSKAIFFVHAGIIDDPNDVDFQDILEQLLELCGGLPLLLAVVGRRMAEEDSEDKLSTRLRNQLVELKSEARRVELLESEVPNNYPTSLHAAIMLSVYFIEKKLRHLRAKASENFTVVQMFQSLSVLSKQGWIPISVLSRLWKTNAKVYVEHFNRLRLVSLKTRSWKVCRPSFFSENDQSRRTEQGVMLHDLTLDICRMQARLQPPTLNTKDPVSWHGILLKSYLCDQAIEITNDSSLCIDDQHRPWWSKDVPEDGYIHSNLSRHLIAAGRRKELWSLLLNPEWSKLRIVVGKFLALQKDLTVLLEDAKENTVQSEEEVQNLFELKLVYRSLRCAWGRIEILPREYPYQMLGRLSNARESMPVVHFFLTEVEKSAEKPWLKPVSQCFEDPRDGPENEVHLETLCKAVSYFPCGKLVAICVGAEVRVVELRTRSIITQCRGHEQQVEDVAVSSDGRWIASTDGKDIRVWNKRTSRQTGRAIKCTSSYVAIRDVDNEDNGFHIVSLPGGIVKAWDLYSQRAVAYAFKEEVADAGYVSFANEGYLMVCGLRDRNAIQVWNMEDGTKIGEPLRCPSGSGNLSCLAVSSDGKTVACGSRNGFITFWNITCSDPTAEQLTGEGDLVSAIEISKDMKLLFSGSNTGDLRAWDLQNRGDSGKLIGNHTFITSISLSPDGTRLASVSHDHALRIWDVSTRILSSNMSQSKRHHAGPVSCVTSSPDGRFVISGSWDKTVCVWDSATGKRVGTPFSGHSENVDTVIVSRDSSMIYSSASSTKKVICWNLESWAECSPETFAQSGVERSSALSLRNFEIFSRSHGDRDFCLAQIPVQMLPLKYHIDVERDLVYVGLSNGIIMFLQVQK